MGVFRGNDEEIGCSRGVDQADYDVCNNGLLLSPNQQGAKRKDYYDEGFSPRRSYLPLSLSFVCGGVNGYASEGLISGISVCRGAPRISHLLFADNCIIFEEASVREGNWVLKVLDDYERELGQKLNREKTLLFFSKNTRREIQEEIKNSFGAQIIHKHERYLMELQQPIL